MELRSLSYERDSSYLGGKKKKKSWTNSLRKCPPKAGSCAGLQRAPACTSEGRGVSRGPRSLAARLCGDRCQVAAGVVTAGEWLHHQRPTAIHQAAPAGEESQPQQGAEPSNISLNKVTTGRFVPMINLVDNPFHLTVQFLPPPTFQHKQVLRKHLQNNVKLPKFSLVLRYSASFFKTPYKSWKITFTTGCILGQVLYTNSIFYYLILTDFFLSPIDYWIALGQFSFFYFPSSLHSSLVSSLRRSQMR
jgi:hypothetical protein